MDHIESLFKAIATYVDAEVGRQVKEALAATSAPPEGWAKSMGGTDGKDGVDGKDGLDGKNGETGPAGKDGEPGQKGDQGEKGDAGDRGEPGSKGDKGDPGEPGEKGEPGKDGESIKGEPGEDGKDGVDGEDGDDGTSVTPEDLRPMIEEACRVAMESMPKAKDGARGADGRDALQIEVLPAIDEAKSYPRGSIALKDGGTWRAFEQTAGMRGWECIKVGVAALEVTQDVSDPRKFSVVTRLSNGVPEVREFTLPAMIYREIFVEGREYAVGDVATFGGSTWHCQEPTKDKPGTSKAWRLMVKKGADGKDGDKGPQGDPGRNGKDWGK